MATIIFDLDGTLIQTAPLVFPAYREAIKQFPGHPIPSEEVMGSTFGHPDEEIWRMLMPGASEAERTRAFAFSEAYVKEQMFQHDVLLPFAREVLTALKEQGHTLTTASNCGQAYLDSVLDSQGIREFFTNPLCLGGVGGERKADILTAHFQTMSKDNAVMVGDRSSDVEAAKYHGIPCIGCLFGFGPEEELNQATTRIRSLKELIPLFADSNLPLLFPHRRG